MSEHLFQIAKHFQGIFQEFFAEVPANDPESLQNGWTYHLSDDVEKTLKLPQWLRL